MINEGTVIVSTYFLWPGIANKSEILRIDNGSILDLSDFSVSTGVWEEKYIPAEYNTSNDVLGGDLTVPDSDKAWWYGSGDTRFDMTGISHMDRSNATIWSVDARGGTYDSGNPYLWYSEDLIFVNDWANEGYEQTAFVKITEGFLSALLVYDHDLTDTENQTTVDWLGHDP